VVFVFSPISSHLVSLAKFVSLLFVLSQQQRALRVGYKLALFQATHGSVSCLVRSWGWAFLCSFVCISGILFPLPHSPPDLFTSVLSLRCLLWQSPTPAAQDGVETSEGDTLTAPGQLEFQLQWPHIPITQLRNQPSSPAPAASQTSCGEDFSLTGEQRGFFSSQSFSKFNL